MYKNIIERLSVESSKPKTQPLNSEKIKKSVSEFKPSNQYKVVKKIDLISQNSINGKSAASKKRIPIIKPEKPKEVSPTDSSKSKMKLPVKQVDFDDDVYWL